MSRALAAFAPLLLAGCAMSAQPAGAPPPAAARPNLILITAEDLSPRFGAYGDTVAVTPNIDRLAAEGVSFMRAFTTAGVCAPSRSALITGVHQETLGTMHMRTRDFGTKSKDGTPYEAVPPAEVKAFPELLRAAGYFTINDQKTDYQFGNPFTVWDQNRDGADWNARSAGQPFFAMINHEHTHESRTWPPGIARCGRPTNTTSPRSYPRTRSWSSSKGWVVSMSFQGQGGCDWGAYRDGNRKCRPPNHAFVILAATDGVTGAPILL